MCFGQLIEVRQTHFLAAGLARTETLGSIAAHGWIIRSLYVWSIFARNPLISSKCDMSQVRRVNEMLWDTRALWNNSNQCEVIYLLTKWRLSWTDDCISSCQLWFETCAFYPICDERIQVEVGHRNGIEKTIESHITAKRLHVQEERKRCCNIVLPIKLMKQK